jgi:hypothetical protein
MSTGIIRFSKWNRSAKRESVNKSNVRLSRSRFKVTSLDLENRLIHLKTIAIIIRNLLLSKESNRFMFLLNKMSHKELYIKVHIQLTRLLSNQLKVLNRTYKRFNKSQEFLIESYDIKTRARYQRPIMKDLLMNLVNNRLKMTPLKTSHCSQTTPQR